MYGMFALYTLNSETDVSGHAVSVVLNDVCPMPCFRHFGVQYTGSRPAILFFTMVLPRIKVTIWDNAKSRTLTS